MRVACFILAFWGVYLSTVAVLLTVLTPSFLRPRSHLVYSLERQLRRRRLRHRHRHHPYLKRRSRDISSDHTLIDETTSKGRDQVPSLAFIPHHVRVGSIQSGSSLHTTSTDDTFFTSTNTSSEHLSHCRTFSMKRSCCRKDSRNSPPRPSSPLPRSPYSRFKSFFKHDNTKSCVQGNIKPRSVLSIQIFDRYPDTPNGLSPDPPFSRVPMTRSNSFPLSDPTNKIRSKWRWKLLPRATDTRHFY